MMSKLIRCAVLVLSGIAIAAPARAQATRDAKTIVNDAWITTQVYAKFFADPDIKGRNINVDTTAGVVTLSGEVHSAAEHTQAVGKAKADRPATADIRDKVAATLPRDKEQAKAQAKSAAQRVGKEISDTWITTQVQAMYFLDREVKGMQINVTTNAGVVTLSGSVDSDAVRQKAMADAKSIEGVKQVVDKLAVKK